MKFIQYNSIEEYRKNTTSNNSDCWLYENDLEQVKIPNLAKNKVAMEFYSTLERRYVLQDWDDEFDNNGAIGLFKDFINGQEVTSYPEIFFK